ncbi:ADP-ribosylglycohydrolase family protein [Parabacteroides pacaensis]|uniref:ADP-ribosylglycohydrolase family protein n=1 Tax=Parabacteroides pacaensis TaxID=2086575 RepID=UPI000D0E9E5F|nr:ADP-ribosylglycohydrolase family protein [Parabacteroides pacaensis]
MGKNVINDRIRGSLIGGAIGDALGYPVEFLFWSNIQNKYGAMGITRYDTAQWQSENSHENGVALVSDDTQMTLYTACGILNAEKNGTAVIPTICEAYIEWLLTQIRKKKIGFEQCWIRELPQLNDLRAPGNTCINSLMDIMNGNEPCNNSKGCGGVMRIAPIPLYGAVDNRIDIKETCLLAAKASELTHQHSLGYIPSAFVAYLIYRLAQDEHPKKESYRTYIKEGLFLISDMYPKNRDTVGEFILLVDRAMYLANKADDDVKNIEYYLGRGWVAEETVAIAVYCSLAHFDDFERAIIAAVNHSGDSDSTGAVTGNILGAAIGYENLPRFYKENLELHDVILHIADDLYQGKESKYK